MLSTATQDSVVSIADAIRRGDPDSIAETLRAEGVDAPAPRSFVHIVGVALAALARLLEQDSGQEAAQAHSVALLTASLPPAVRAECAVVLRKVAALFPDDILDELHASPSPHVRAGAGLLAELLASDDDPQPVGEEPPPWRETIVVADESPDAAETNGDAGVGGDLPADLDSIARRRPTESVALLWMSLRSSSPSVRHDILRRLRAIDEPALRVLARFGVGSADADQRVVSVTALADLTDESDEPLLAATGDPSPDVRLAALRAIERRGCLDGGVDAASRRVLDPRPDVREAAVAVLQAARNLRTVPHLLTAAADPVESVRRRARDAIKSMATTPVIDLITPGLRSLDTEQVAFELLVELGEAATDSVIDSIEGASSTLRGRIGEILRATGGARRVRALLSDPDATRRARAADAVAAIGGREATEILLGILQDPDCDVRVRAVELLAERSDPGIADELALTGLSEPDRRVVAAINRAVRQLTHATPDASGPEDPNG
jgi:HEAT repeat protein